MKIRDYIHTEVFASRAAKHGALVIYDPARRYHNLALALDTPQCRVIDAGPSTIEAREAAMRALRDPDAFPVGDLGVRLGFEALGLPSTPAAIRDHADRWRPWRAYAVMHLWHGHLTS